ncbi:MAG: outer membrane lipoprotein carrier protein LolA [Deltaproteobacteria bacterium]|nr:outer membrane lipoprotein carrier protein LolA [Deltaproteobacteria bacterium]
MIKQKGCLKARCLFPVLILLFLAFTPSAVFADATQQDILEAVQKRYKDMSDMVADYTRVTSSPAMESVFRASSEHKASGRLLFKKPNKLIINQKKPRPEILVTNGDTVWWYIPEDNQVQRYQGPDLFTELKPFVDFLAGLASLDDRFTITLAPAESVPKNIHELILVPLNKEISPQKVILWLDARDYSLIGLRFTSILKETTDFHFHNVQYNLGISGDRFEFQIPPGAEVIDAESQ